MASWLLQHWRDEGRSLRGVLAQLTLLFFLAHPGSAATFGDTRTFLVSRYPNRDVVPATLMRHRRGGVEPSLGVSPAAPSSGAPLLFVAVPVPRPLQISKPVEAPGCARGQGGSVSCPSPSRQGGATARRVVIGDFVSSLEARRGVSASQQQQQQPQGVHPPRNHLRVLAEPEPHQHQHQAEVRPSGGSGTLRMGVDGLLRRSTSTIVGAYDSVVGFMGSRLVNQGEDLLSWAGSKLEGREPATFKFPELKAGHMRQDLVGFMDLDPFEKSRRNFKSNSKFFI
jgi:hypothetical protein